LFFLLNKHFFRKNIKMPPTSTHLKYWKTQEPKYNNPVCKHALFDIWLTDVFLFFLSPSLPLNRLVHMARLCHERLVKLQYSIMNCCQARQSHDWCMKQVTSAHFIKSANRPSTQLRSYFEPGQAMAYDGA
jgi:hypothetical protein